MADVNLPADPITTKFTNVGGIISLAIKYVYVIAGLSLLAMLIYGGVMLMTAAGDPKKADGGYKLISNALIGFFIIFISYWLVKIVEVMLGAQIF